MARNAAVEVLERAPVGGMNMTVALIDDDPSFSSRLSLGADTPIRVFQSAEDLEDRLPVRTPAVAVFGPSYAHKQRLGDIHDLLRGRPELGVVLVAERISTALLREALRAGVRDVLVWPDDADQLEETVLRVGRALGTPVLDADGGAGLEPGRVLTVFSPKGGSGKSVVSTNLAVALAGRPGRRSTDGPVALLDLDLQFGDVAVMLGLRPDHTISDLISAGRHLDRDVVLGAMCRHEPSGLLVLPAPIDPAVADHITASEVMSVLSALRAICSYVVVDMPAQFNDVVLGVLEESDDILMVSSFDVPSIKNTKLGLQTLQLLSIPPEKVIFLLNGVSSKVGLSVADVERTLHAKVDLSVPRDVLVPRSVNHGAPAVLEDPKSAVAKAFRDLADRIAVRSSSRTRG